MSNSPSRFDGTFPTIAIRADPSFRLTTVSEKDQVLSFRDTWNGASLVHAFPRRSTWRVSTTRVRPVVDTNSPLLSNATVPLVAALARQRSESASPLAANEMACMSYLPRVSESAVTVSSTAARVPPARRGCPRVRNVIAVPVQLFRGRLARYVHRIERALDGEAGVGCAVEQLARHRRIRGGLNVAVTRESKAVSWSACAVM
jgi:hypothetical protein